MAQCGWWWEWKVVNGRGLPNGGIGGIVTRDNVKDDQRVAVHLLRRGQMLLGLLRKRNSDKRKMQGERRMG